MRRYIDADGFFETFEELDKEPYTTYPASEVRENVRGEWISHDLENGEKSIDKDCCSVCGERFREIAMTGCEWNFCPNCGADMRTAKQRIHDAIDNTPMAEDVYVGIKEKLHKAVDAVDELSSEGEE